VVIRRLVRGTPARAQGGQAELAGGDQEDAPACGP